MRVWNRELAGRTSTVITWFPRCAIRGSAASARSEPDAVGVAVSVGADVGVAVAPLVGDFAQDDDAGGAAVDAEGAAGADVFVDDEEDVVFGVVAGLVGVDGVG